MQILLLIVDSRYILIYNPHFKSISKKRFTDNFYMIHSVYTGVIGHLGQSYDLYQFTDERIFRY